jgi:hypothetical protein
MSLIAHRKITPTSELVLNYVNGSTKPQSVISVSGAVGASYDDPVGLVQEPCELRVYDFNAQRQITAILSHPQKTHPDQESRN